MLVIINKRTWWMCLVILITWATSSNAQKSKEQLGVSASKQMTPRQQLSYTYGYKMGKAIAPYNLSKAEKNPNMFAAGFMNGLVTNATENEQAQADVAARIQANEVSTTKEAADKVAFRMGFTAISPLALVVKVPTSDFEEGWFAKGFRAVVEDKKWMMKEKDMERIFQAYIKPKSEAYQDRMKANEKADIEANITAGKAFLEHNKTKEGVITTESGFQYKIIKEGTGPQPTLTDEVLTNYHGTLIDGTVFDSSVDRGKPTSFIVNQVIQGWQEGLSLMKEGAQYRFYIPQELAYGMRSPIDALPAGSTLIFDVELLKVNPE